MQRVKKETIFLILAIAVIFFSLIVSLPSGSDRMDEKDRIMPVSDGWYYMKNGEKTSVELPVTISYPEDEPLILYNDSLTQDAAGRMLTTRGIQHGLLVSMNDEILYEYSDEYFPRNNQMKSKYDCDIQIPADIQVGVLKVVYEKEKSGNYALSPFYIGSGSAVMWQHFMNNAVIIGIAFLFILLSVIAAGISVYLHFTRIDKKRFFDTAVFLFICSVWFVTDSSLTQIQSGNAPAVCIISFYAFMLLAVPMLYFIKHTADLKKYRILDWLIRLFYLNAILQGVLHLTLKIDFRDMLVVTHLLLVIGVGITSILLIREYIQNRTRDIGMILAAYAMLGASGILSLLLYWILEIPYYGTIFEFGILLFVLIIIANIVMIMAENIHYRTEMQVYQRLLREDWMTGMENRQPFDDYLEEIQRNPAKYRNAALIFFNVNQLKRTNEESGHAAGDELILGAAKCISVTFGMAGRCYRLEGDEFCVIIENSQITKEEWFHRFDLAIQKYNRNNQYWLSIARGWSDFYQEDGSWKTISNWKYDADHKLHENKGELNGYENV